MKTVANTANSLLNSNLGSQPPVAAKRFWRKNEIISSLNGIVKINADKTFKVGVNFLHDNSFYNSSTLSNYYLNNQYISLSEDMNPHFDQKRMQSNLEFKLNSQKLYLLNKTSLEAELNNNDFNLIINEEKINQLKRNNLFSMHNRFSLYKKAQSKHYRFSSTLGYSRLPKNRLTFIGVKNTAGDFFQTSTGESFSADESFSFAYNMGRMSKLSIGISSSVDYDNIYTYLQRNDMAVHNRNYGYKMVSSISPSYTIESSVKRFSISVNLPISLYNLSFKDDKETVDFQFKKPFISPSIIGYYTMTPLLKAEFRGGLYYGVGDITEFLLQPLQVSYRQQQTRSGILAQNRSANGSIKLLYKNPIKLWFVNAWFGGSQNRRNIIDNQQFEEGSTSIDISSTDIANVNTSRSLSAGAYASKRLRSIKTTFLLRTNYGVSFGNILRQGVMNEIASRAFAISATINSDPTKQLSINYSSSYSQNAQIFSQKTTIYHQQFHYMSVSYKMPRNVILLSKWDFNRRELKENIYKNMHLFDVALRYKGKKFEIELKCNNIFNLREYAYNIFSELDQFSYRYYLRPREVMAMIKFSL